MAQATYCLPDAWPRMSITQHGSVWIYASGRRWPRTGAPELSPWIRHGLLPPEGMWESIEGGPPPDVAKFRDELLGREYARHLYARVGIRSVKARRCHGPPEEPPAPRWSREMACVDEMQELEARRRRPRPSTRLPASDQRVRLATLHPWLVPPHKGSVANFSAWRKAAGR